MKIKDITKTKNNVQMQRLCENIRKLRAYLGLSKSKMAKIRRVGVKTLTALESGRIPDRFMFSSVLRLYYEFKISPHSMLTADVVELIEKRKNKKNMQVK